MRTVASMNAEQDAKDPKLLSAARTGPCMYAGHKKAAIIGPHDRTMVCVNKNLRYKQVGHVRVRKSC